MRRDNLLAHSFNGMTVGLQAEVLRKKREFDQSKTNSDLTSHNSSSTPLFTRTKRAKLDNKTTKSGRKQKQTDSSVTDELLIKSQLALEKKARLYDELNKVKNIDSVIKHSDSYLVDFETKLTDSKLDNNNKLILSKEEEKDESDNEKETSDISSLITEINTLGHTQTNLKSDIPKESEYLHYQEAVGKEIRERGVGYFAFSTDEATRRRQMADIERIHRETERNIAQRKNQTTEIEATSIKGDDDSIEGVKTADPEDTETSKSTQIERDDAESEKLEQQKQAVFKLIDSIRESTRKPTVREWDRGKLKKHSHSYPIEKDEDEKNPEFAPPDFYTPTKKLKYLDS